MLKIFEKCQNSGEGKSKWWQKYVKIVREKHKDSERKRFWGKWKSPNVGRKPNLWFSVNLHTGSHVLPDRFAMVLTFGFSSPGSMTFDPIIQTEDVPASQEGLHRVDPERPPQSRLQQRQTPETVLLEGEDGDQENPNLSPYFCTFYSFPVENMQNTNNQKSGKLKTN